PSEPRLPVMIAVLIPITWPARSTSGPPELPGLIAASVCKKALELAANATAVLRADDAGRNGGLKSKGTANRENPITDLHAIGIAELGGGEISAGVNFNDGEVGIFVRSDNLRDVLVGVSVELDLNLGGLLNHVI